MVLVLKFHYELSYDDTLSGYGIDETTLDKIDVKSTKNPVTESVKM